MIDPFKPDLGRAVIQQEYVGGPFRRGTITSFNPDYVFVQCENEGFSRSFPREELFFEEDWLASHR